MLDARDLRKSYSSADGTTDVLRGISLHLSRGESVALSGESGSGKSTLLHCLGCLDAVDSGTLHLEETPLHDLDEAGRADIRRTRFGIVFQQLNLIPSLTVAQNLSFQARLADRTDSGWLSELTERLGLNDMQSRYPEQLSGGQQQRVAIGRAIATRPDVVLADEPTGNLDEETSDKVLDLLLDLVEASGASLLMVTHSQRHAARLGRVLHLERGRIA